MGSRDAAGRSTLSSLRQSADENPTLAAIVAITAVALLVRFLFLGDRIAHFDEGRVAWWALNYMNTGEIHYRFIIHGPLVQHVNRWLFALVGANDFTMRLPIAIIGGLLPLSVYLYREHLRGAEMIALAFFLAFNPVLVYYSRFYRSTLPVAAFGFVAFGLLVRALDTRDPRYVHAAAAVGALMIAAKENAVIYYVTWVGAAAVVAALVLIRNSGPTVVSRFWDRYVREYLLTRSAVVTTAGTVFTVGLFLAFYLLGNTFPSTEFEPLAYVVAAVAAVLMIYLGVFTDKEAFGILGHVVLAGSIFGALAFFFYAPRAGTTGGVGLWKTVAYLRIAFVDLLAGFLALRLDTSGFTTFFDQVGLLVQVTFDDVTRGFEYWFGGATEKEIREYESFLKRFLNTTGTFAGPVLVLSFVGAAVELFNSRRPRYVVVAVFAWGLVSIFGYPLGTDIYGGWITVNAVLPLALPAGVGLGAFYAWLKGWLLARPDDSPSAGAAAADGGEPSALGRRVDWFGVAIVAVTFLVVVAGTGAGMYTGAYTNDQSDDNSLVQYAQPGGDWRPAIHDMRAAAADNEGTDVLFYGSQFVRSPSDGPRDRGLYPLCSRVGNVLPLHWYVNVTDSTADCAYDAAALERKTNNTGPPPVIVADSGEKEFLEDQFPSYHSRTYLLRTFGPEVTFFIHPDYANRTE